MNYPLFLNGTSQHIATLTLQTEPKVGEVFEVEGQKYEVQGRTGGSHGVGFTDGTLPPITSISMWVIRG